MAPHADPPARTADVAQLVAHRSCKAVVRGSSPLVGSTTRAKTSKVTSPGPRTHGLPHGFELAAHWLVGSKTGPCTALGRVMHGFSGCTDTPGRPDRLTSFSTSSRRAPPGPESAPPPQDRGSGAASGSSPKGSSAPSPVGLARTCQRVPVADSRTRHQRSTPCRCVYSPNGRPPAAVVQAACRLTLGYRIVPLAIMEGTVRPGPRQGRLRRRSAIEQARP